MIDTTADGFKVDLADLDLMEKRVAELEKYLGLDDLDLDTFQLNQLETLDKKAQKLDDFSKVVEDKHFLFMELYSKCNCIIVIIEWV